MLRTDKASRALNSEQMEQIERIVVVCWGLIGDVFIRVPLLEALRQRFPKAHIAALVDRKGRIVLQRNPSVDELIECERVKRPRTEYIRRMLACIRALRAKDFDLAIDLYGGGSTPFLIRMSGARWRLGFNHTRKLRWATNLQVPHPSFCENWTAALATMLAPLNIDPTRVRRGTSFVCGEDAMAYARDFLGQLDSKTLVVNLGAGKAEKRWPVSEFVRFSDTVYRQYGVIPVVLTNPGMEYLADEFEAEYKKNGMPYLRSPLTSFDQDAAIINCADFVITGDTSIMHLSFGLKKPTLVLFTYTRPQIVSPADCVYEACFVPHPTDTDECGNPVGSRDIPLAMVLEKFHALHKRVTD